MNRFIFMVAFLLLQVNAFAQLRVDFSKIPLDDATFYIVSRGTNSKAGMVASVFNTVEYCSTHVGLAIAEDGELQVYHVANDNPDHKTALVKESAEAFSACEGAVYFSIWQYQSSLEVLPKLNSLLQDYAAKEILFDYDFDASDDSKMYCSEFCVKVLRTVNDYAFNFPLATIRLDALCAFALGKETLVYWPVDFYQTSGDFKKVYEAYSD